jgi:ribosomal protein S18 acetylase RimI-like enzyme
LSAGARFNVRFARPDDRGFIVENMQAMARETEGIELDRAKLEFGVGAALADASLGRYLIAEAAGGGAEPVASLMLTREWSDWRGAWYLWIQSVYVRPEWRGRGAYRAMHARVMQLAREEGAFEVRLYVAEENTGAQRTYERVGMKKSNYVMYEEEV